jgi:hypothetical protein
MTIARIMLVLALLNLIFLLTEVSVNVIESVAS